MRELIQSEIERLTAAHQQAVEQIDKWNQERLKAEGAVVVLASLLNASSTAPGEAPHVSGETSNEESTDSASPRSN